MLCARATQHMHAGLDVRRRDPLNSLKVCLLPPCAHQGTRT